MWNTLSSTEEIHLVSLADNYFLANASQTSPLNLNFHQSHVTGVIFCAWRQGCDNNSAL